MVGVPGSEFFLEGVDVVDDDAVSGIGLRDGSEAFHGLVGDV